MKIAANPLPFLDIAPLTSAAGGSADYGRAFESTIQDVAKDSAAQVKARDDRSSSRQDDADQQPAPAKSAPVAPVSEKSSDSKATKSKAAEDHKAAKDADAKDDDAADDAVAALGRLLGGAVASPVAAAKAVDADADGKGQVIVVSLEAGNADAAVEDASASGARGKVKLDVVHMETHFEPRSDAFVLVDGTDANGMVVGAAEEGGAPLSFDQALARLSQRKAAKAAAGTEEAKSASAVAAAGKADVAVAHEVTAQERTKDRVRGKVTAELSAKAADQQDAEVEIQNVTAAKKKDAVDASTDKIAVKLNQAASDAADARRSTNPIAAKEPTAVSPLASMTSQVAGRVIDALGTTLASQQPSSLPSDAYLKMTAGGAALKTLTIQLQPETLGKLDVSMRLVDGQLTLEIAATEADTAKVLAQDREGLRKLLQHAGFSVDDASITIVTRDNSMQPQVRAAAAGDAAGAQQDSGASANGDPRDRGDSSSSRRQGSTRDDGSQSSDKGRRTRASADYL